MSQPPSHTSRGDTAAPVPAATGALYRAASGYPSLVSCDNSVLDLEKLDTPGEQSERVSSLEIFAVGNYHCVACPICLEAFTLENPAVLVSCEHSFHLQCLESWRQRSTTCPVCVQLLSDDDAHVMCATNTRRTRRRLRMPGLHNTLTSSVAAEENALACADAPGAIALHNDTEDEEAPILEGRDASPTSAGSSRWCACLCCWWRS